jgi:hypothetical protein
VARQAFPQFTTTPFLLVPDKTKRTAIEGLNGQFRVVRGPVRPGGFQPCIVTYEGDLQALRADDILTKLPVTERVDRRLEAIASAAQRFAGSLNPELQRLATPRSLKCAKCEYKGASPDAPDRDGFLQCWPGSADAPPTILELYQAGNIDRFQGGVLNALIAEGRTSLHEVPDEVLEGPDPQKPYYNRRPWMQKHHATEHVSEELRAELRAWSYPLHFIDFETSRMALPYHRDMRPWEQIGFQWSCHTIAAPGAAPSHAEWLNTTDAFPSFAFVRSLRDHIKTGGTVLTWSHHENSVLRDIRSQMDVYGHVDTDLAAWLDELVRDKKTGLEGRLTDMNAMAGWGYFHPETRGKTSIKYTLPAVLKEHRSQRIRAWLEHFGERASGPVSLWAVDGQGVPVNPYQLLPEVGTIEGYAVREGTGAMTAYKDMLYGELRNDPVRSDALAEALRLYCKLDTLAMVVIWEHWRG